MPVHLPEARPARSRGRKAAGAPITLYEAAFGKPWPARDAENVLSPENSVILESLGLFGYVSQP